MNAAEARAAPRRWIACFAAALLLHAGAGALLLQYPIAAPPDALPAVMMLELAPLAPHPEPAPAPKPPPPSPIARPAVPMSKPPPRPPPPHPKVTTATPPVPPAAPALSPPAPSPPATAAPAAPSAAMITWQSRLLAQLARYRRYPIEARRLHQQGTASVRIIIGGRGNVISARIEHSAGVPSLDAEALALIDRAQPLPPPPDATAQTTIELVVPLRFQLR